MHSALLALIFGLLLASARHDVFELCRGRLVQLPEPANWRALPESSAPSDDDSRLGPFVVSGRFTMPKYQMGWADSMINDPGFCRSSGLSLGAWFDRGPEPTYQRSPGELRLREDGRGAFVVSAFMWWSSEKPPANQAFVVAFRRQLGVYPRFGSPAQLLHCLLLSVGLLASLYSGLSAGRALRQLQGAHTKAPDASAARRPDTDIHIAHARLGLWLALAALAIAAVWLGMEIGEAVCKEGFYGP